ncbi:MAG: shikimate kinase [Chitinophagales bacterium]
MRIYLIGFMGSGKSTFAKRLAQYLDYDLADMDHLIEQVEKHSIPEIFQLHGEEYFRRTESDVLHSTLLFENAVIACGGGTPCYFDNMDWMNKRGITVYLHQTAERLFGRLREKKNKRPLIAHMEDGQLRDYIIQKLAEREAFYLQSKIVAEMDKISKNDLMRMIKEHIKVASGS